MPQKRRKHVPLRTCVACRQKRPKRELIRIVRTPEGVVEVDPKGKRPGRGAYLCLKHRCWNAALGEERLNRALKCQVRADDLEVLRAFGEKLLQQETEAGGIQAGGIHTPKRA